MKKQIKAALDFSGGSAALALEIDSELVLSTSKIMARRESALLADWIINQLASVQVTVEDVKYWTCGAGPGSFTGMRLAAALIEGWSFGKSDIRRRSVPGALAIAESIDLQEGEICGVLFDGRNREMLLFEVTKSQGVIVHTGRTAILNQAQANQEFAELGEFKLCALADDMTALGAILPSPALDRVQQINQLPIAQMLRDEYGEYDGDLTKLVYIRPSVIAKEN